jgi:ELWxxDGT repeat protein
MRISGWVCGFALLLLPLPAVGVEAGPAHLVADIKPGLDPFNPEFPGASFGSYTAVNGRVVFFGFLPEGSPFLGGVQCGLWATDGTAGGTERLTDLCGELPVPYNVTLRMLATSGAVAFFTGTAGELWRTDGTAAGTFPLGGVRVGGEPSDPPVIGPDRRTLFFNGCTPALGCEPWRSDGSRQGTRAIGDLLPGTRSSNPSRLTTDGGRVLFTSLGGLWSSDGTAAGTVLLAQLSARLNPFALGKPLPHGGRIYFFVFAAEQDLWVYDPAARKARKLRGFPYDPSDRSVGADLAEVGGRLLIRQNDPNAPSASLWESDGTRAGTRQLGPPFKFSTIDRIYDLGGKALFPAIRSAAPGLRLWSLAPGMKRPLPLRDCPGGCPFLDYGEDDGAFAVHAGRLFFPGRDAAHGRELWTTDGTGAGTRLVADLCPGPCDGGPVQLRAALGRLVFSDAAGELWATDGTLAGTVRVAAIRRAPSPLDLAVAGGRIFFTGIDTAAGPQPFASDLTPGGTGFITSLGDGLAASSSPSALAPFGGRVLFEACGPASGGLWSSDGTAAGTFLLPGTEAPCELGRYPEIFQWIGGLAFFDWNGRLWRTDGTAPGTIPLLDLPDPSFARSQAALSGRLLFVLDPPAGTPPSSPGFDWTFWTSDGTPAGTREVFSLRFGGTPDPLVVSGDLAFFTAPSPVPPHRHQLWRTDGTAAGTFPILSDTGGGAFGVETARLGGRTYLILYHGSAGRGLLVTDGTAAGTVPVLPDTAGSRPLDPYSLVAFQDALYFFADSGDPGRPKKGLWRSDGTAAGTRLVKAIDPPRNSQAVGGFLLPELTPAGDQLFFRADDGVHGTELWKTDGTPEGTVLVKDIAPGAATSRLGDLTAAGGRLYFGADDAVHGFELWRSDGTAAGTTLVQDIVPGPESSNPQELAAGGGTLYFTANDGEHGRELWALPLP